LLPFLVSKLAAHLYGKPVLETQLKPATLACRLGNSYEVAVSTAEKAIQEATASETTRVEEMLLAISR